MSISDTAEVLVLDPKKMPRHVAIIMDGNGRWAKLRGWHRTMGHAYGTQRVKEIIRAADRMGIKVLTLYAFSTENWSRPSGEIEALMQLLRDYLLKERQELLDNNIKLQALGQIERIPTEVRKILEETLEVTSPNTGMLLNFCLSYGGRADIIQATQRLAREVASGQLEISQIDETRFSNYLYTSGIPDPDLVIRTSGEFRISNFLLWQMAYSEIFVTDTSWPDFEPSHLRAACEAFSQRRRRFGQTDESQRKPL
jgi:undecaprenyl diphosphate synthase